MPELKRITPEEVVADFEKSKLKPMRGGWFPVDGCACALGAKFAAMELDPKDTQITGYFDQIYGDQYRVGFVKGFDGDAQVSDSSRKNTGYEDGQAAWEAVKHLAIQNESGENNNG